MEVVDFFPSLELITGCMYAAKTSTLLQRLTVYKEMKLSVVLISSSLDTRNSTHNPIIGSMENPGEI